MNNSSVIFPVILAVPAADQALRGRAKTTALSWHARRALQMSVERSGLAPGLLPKGEDGAPIPSNGCYWSLSHKTAYVGGVAAESQIGIDIEQIRPIQNPLYRKTATDDEWLLSDEDRLSLFFRYWTAKEAVLKVAAVGLKDLSCCRISRVIDAYRLTVDYLGKSWMIVQTFFDGHVAAVVNTAEKICWTLISEDGRSSKL